MLPSHLDIEDLFCRCFSADWNTRLCGGFDEPEYFPATASSPAIIGYRHDYARSALHEVAHWCVAGEQRRKLPDYGYWYSPDGRTASEQQRFYQVELRPQSIEWLFSLAADIAFSPSIDNLSGTLVEEDPDAAEFGLQLRQQVSGLLTGNLYSSRVRQFVSGLYRLSTGVELEPSSLGAVLAQRLEP